MTDDTQQDLIEKIAQVMRWNGAPGDRARGARFSVIDGGDGSIGMEMDYWYDSDGAQKYDFLRAKNGLRPGGLAMELRRAMHPDGKDGWSACEIALSAEGAATAAFEYPGA